MPVPEAPPPSAQLIEAFANTLNLEYGTDTLSTPGELSDWLLDRGLIERSPRASLSPALHAQYLALRAGIREQLGANVGVPADPDLVEAADEVLRAVPLNARITTPPLTGGAELSPARQPLAALATAWVELCVTGDALRLKRCAEHSCELVFWDVSKNRSRKWCSMRVCGNRVKSRAYAARRAAVDVER